MIWQAMKWRDCIFDPPPPNETQLVRSGGSMFFAGRNERHWWFNCSSHVRMNDPPFEWLGPEEKQLELFD